MPKNNLSGNTNIKNIKTKLYNAGYYNPEPRSEPGGQLHEYNNDNLRNAITSFQNDNGLPATGTMNDLTTEMLDKKYNSAPNSLSDKSSRMPPIRTNKDSDDDGEDADEQEYDDDDTENNDDIEEKFWVWDAGGGCDDCSGMDGAIVDCPNDVGCPHPNCKCTATLMSESEFNKKYGGIKKSLQDKLKEVREERNAYEDKYGPDSLGRNSKMNTPDDNGNQRLNRRGQDRAGNGDYGASRLNADGTRRIHEGIDISMKPDDNIYAYVGGVVQNHGSSDNSKENRGNIINIKHDDGMVGRYYYTNPGVPPNTRIEKGDKIGTLKDMSTTYGNTPSHLHFETRTNKNQSSQKTNAGRLWGNAIDPLKYLKQQGHCSE